MSKDTDTLVEIIRFSSDPEERKRALAELRELGLVEQLENAPAANTEPDGPKTRRTWKQVLLIIIVVISTLCLFMFCVILTNL